MWPIRYASRRERATASRLEALTRQVGKNVILSQAFADLVKGDVELESVGEFPVRGFNEPVELFAYGGDVGSSVRITSTMGAVIPGREYNERTRNPFFHL